MNARDDSYRQVGCLLIAGSLAFSAPVLGQSASDAIDSVSGSASVFGGVVHTRLDTGTGEESNTKPSAGVSGDIGGSMSSGANNLDLRYGGRLTTRRSLPNGDQTDDSSITGASRYQYADPSSIMDFNLGHSVQSVRNDTGFVLNAGDYDTRHTVRGGAGLTFQPGEVTSLRLSGQAGKSFGSGDLEDEKSWTAGADLRRRLSARSTGLLTTRRSWSESQGVDTTIDNAELGYERQLETGWFSIAAGGSWSETEFPGDRVTNESEAVTGHVSRIWATTDSSTTVRYERRLSDSATDLSLDLPEELSFLPDTIQLQDLVTTDSVLVAHNTSRLCRICRFSMLAEASMLESELSDAKTHEYRTSLNLSVDITRVHEFLASYSWQAEAGEDSGDIQVQIHRLSLGVTRRLAEDVRLGLELNQAWLRDDQEGSDRDEYGLRVFLTRNFSLMERR